MDGEVMSFSLRHVCYVRSLHSQQVEVRDHVRQQHAVHRVGDVVVIVKFLPQQSRAILFHSEADVPLLARQFTLLIDFICLFLDVKLQCSVKSLKCRPRMPC